VQSDGPTAPTTPLRPNTPSQALGAALLADAVPDAWAAAWAVGPASPGAYLRGLAARAAALEQWSARCQAGALLASGPLDLSQLLPPRALLNALRQQAARQLGASMDQLRLAVAWEGRRLGSAAAQMQVGGLLIQGAAFDGARLAPVGPGAPTSAPVPVMHVAWVLQGTPEVYASRLSVPLYADGARGSVLAEVQLPLGGEEEAAQWVLAGVALVLAGQ
jgi:dynein heavy chain 2